MTEVSLFGNEVWKKDISLGTNTFPITYLCFVSDLLWFRNTLLNLTN